MPESRLRFAIRIVHSVWDHSVNQRYRMPASMAPSEPSATRAQLGLRGFTTGKRHFKREGEDGRLSARSVHGIFLRSTQVGTVQPACWLCHDHEHLHGLPRTCREDVIGERLIAYDDPEPRSEDGAVSDRVIF